MVYIFTLTASLRGSFGFEDLGDHSETTTKKQQRATHTCSTSIAIQWAERLQVLQVLVVQQALTAAEDRHIWPVGRVLNVAQSQHTGSTPVALWGHCGI